MRGSYQAADAGFDQGAAEIVAYDPLTRQAFVVKAQRAMVDVLDMQNINKPRLVATIDVDPNGDGLVANSVAVSSGVLAVALAANPKTDDGFVAFYDTMEHSAPLNTVGVGALPDMVTFSEDGDYVLVANEGEPNDDYSIDPAGSISVFGGIRCCLSAESSDRSAPLRRVRKSMTIPPPPPHRDISRLGPVRVEAARSSCLPPAEDVRSRQ